MEIRLVEVRELSDWVLLYRKGYGYKAKKR
jgi:hypothetical protein